MQTVDHTQTILSISNLSFSYDGVTDVLSRVSMEIHRGDYVGLIGPNGAGKTTLLKIMLGLLAPQSGSIKIFGEDARLSRSREKIGYVPQKATNFDPRFPVSALDVVLMGRYGTRGLFRFVTREDRALSRRALERVDMGAFAHRLIGDMSGGQQQRVFIARALVGRPEILFLDEPTTGIDREAEEDLYALLRKLNRKLGITLVLVSHDVARVTREAMHIACIDRTLRCYMSPEEYRSQEGNMIGRYV